MFVHGWPDSHVLWDSVVEQLRDDYRIIRYDNRGAGASEVPSSPSAYTVEQLADDFRRRRRRDVPGRAGSRRRPRLGRGHRLGVRHRPEAAQRVASSTSISGPDTGQLARFLRDGLSRPYRPRRFARALAQGLHFSYMLFFRTRLAGPIVRAFLADFARRHVINTGVPRQRRHQGPTFVADAANGMKIYRANFPAC